jgi:hypothetical protein
MTTVDIVNRANVVVVGPQFNDAEKDLLDKKATSEAGLGLYLPFFN